VCAGLRPHSTRFSQHTPCLKRPRMNGGGDGDAAREVIQGGGWGPDEELWATFEAATKSVFFRCPALLLGIDVSSSRHNHADVDLGNMHQTMMSEFARRYRSTCIGTSFRRCPTVSGHFDGVGTPQPSSDARSTPSNMLASKHTPDTHSYSGRLTSGVAYCRWTALSLAVDNGWGGKSSASKRSRLLHHVLDMFRYSPPFLLLHS